MEHLRLEIKEVGDAGKFRGIASVYGALDLGGDIIDRGAFRKTIAENPSVVVLWQHEEDEVIGRGIVSEMGNKVVIDAELDMEDECAVKAFNKIKKGLITGLSIGFTTISQKFEEIEGRIIRHITELKLWEVSVVTFPMLPLAQITATKAADELKTRIERLEHEIQALKAIKATPEAEPAPAIEPPAEDHAPQELHASLADLKKSIPASLFS